MIFTARELALIATAAEHLASLTRQIQTCKEDGVQKALETMAESWIVCNSKSQEWGQIYDKAHRYEPPQEKKPKRAIEDLTVKLLALEFAKVLNRTLDETTLSVIVERNHRNLLDGKGSQCATHDFCDANMLMDEALKNLGYAPGDGPVGDNLNIINEAWCLAKQQDFKIYKLRVDQ